MPSHITAHPRKRQFQPDITSYFAFRRRDNNLPTRRTPQKHDSQTQLPEAVQSSLITVGMRVRKAVPEGYPHLKAANKSYSAPQQHQSAPPASAYVQPSQPFLAKTRSPRRYQRRRELEPYSGIHRIGGISAQPTYYDEEGENEWDTLGDSSQDSFASTVSTDSTDQIINHHKRAFDEDQDGDEYECSFRLDADGQTPIFEFGLPTSRDADARRIAIPTSRRRGALATTQVGHRDVVDDFDFGEATFLKFGENDMDLD